MPKQEQKKPRKDYPPRDSASCLRRRIKIFNDRINGKSLRQAQADAGLAPASGGCRNIIFPEVLDEFDATVAHSAALIAEAMQATRYEPHGEIIHDKGHNILLWGKEPDHQVRLKANEQALRCRKLLSDKVDVEVKGPLVVKIVKFSDVKKEKLPDGSGNTTA